MRGPELRAGVVMKSTTLDRSRQPPPRPVHPGRCPTQPCSLLGCLSFYEGTSICTQESLQGQPKFKPALLHQARVKELEVPQRFTEAVVDRSQARVRSDALPESPTGNACDPVL